MTRPYILAVEARLRRGSVREAEYYGDGYEDGSAAVCGLIGMAEAIRARTLTPPRAETLEPWLAPPPNATLKEELRIVRDALEQEQQWSNGRIRAAEAEANRSAAEREIAQAAAVTLLERAKRAEVCYEELSAAILSDRATVRAMALNEARRAVARRVHLVSSFDAPTVEGCVAAIDALRNGLRSESETDPRKDTTHATEEAPPTEAQDAAPVVPEREVGHASGARPRDDGGGKTGRVEARESRAGSAASAQENGVIDRDALRVVTALVRRLCGVCGYDAVFLTGNDLAQASRLELVRADDRAYDNGGGIIFSVREPKKRSGS